MGLFGTLFGLCGFGFGIFAGIVIGYYLFIYSQPTFSFHMFGVFLFITVFFGIIYVQQEAIKDQVANMYLWPKTLDVAVMDPSKTLKKPVGMLQVKVPRAMKPKKKDFLGKSDPYVEVKLTEDKLQSEKTTVKRSNLNPEWNEESHLVVKDPSSQALELNCYDWEQVCLIASLVNVICTTSTVTIKAALISGGGKREVYKRNVHDRDREIYQINFNGSSNVPS